MRICIDARAIADPKTGVSRVARAWIRSALQNRQLTDEIFCITTGSHPSPIVQQFCNTVNCLYIHLPIPNKTWTTGCILKTYALDRTLEDHGLKPDRILLPNLGFCGPLETPYYLLLHDLSFLLDPRWFRFKSRIWHTLLPVSQLIRNAERIDCVSKQTRRDVQTIFQIPPEKTRLFSFSPNLLSAPPQTPSWLPSGRRFALLLGGSDPRKNIRTALTAIAHYNRIHPLEYLMPVVLGGSVRFAFNQQSVPFLQAPSNVSDTEIAYLYKHASVLLYPSWYEGFGLPLHEAAVFQTPLICSIAGALPETAPPGTIFCHPAKPHEWVMGLECLVPI